MTAMTVLPNPPQEAEQNNSLGGATHHISRSELRGSSSGAVQNSLKGTSSGLPETQRKSIGEIAVHLLFCEKFKTFSPVKYIH